MIIKSSHFSVSETIDRLESILSDNGIKVVARVNHAAAAKSVDMDLKPTEVLFFGNPKLGTPLMQQNQLAGLDLPMRVLAWEDDNGETRVAYHDPGQLTDALNIEGASAIVEKMQTALNRFVTGASEHQ